MLFCREGVRLLRRYGTTSAGWFAAEPEPEPGLRWRRARTEPEPGLSRPAPSASEARQHRAVGPLVLDEILHLGGVEQLVELLDALVVLVLGAHGEEVAVRVVLGLLQENAVLGRVEPGFQSIVAVDDRGVDVFEGASQLGCVGLDELDV